VISKEIHLKSRPEGAPTNANFELVEREVSEPGDGEILVENIYMSVDPYMRGRMMDRESYVPPFQIGEPLQGGAIGQVIESKSDALKVGDYVNSMFGWREYFTATPEWATKVDPSIAPLQAYLGALGMPGLTAYAGLIRIGQPKQGETVFVSAASGAVGAIVCQIAKNLGCRVVGSAGSDDKVKWLEDVAGVDRAINYKTCGNLLDAVREACPKGIDVYFENVGGEHLQVALEGMNPFGRIAACGMISQYNDTTPRPGPTNLIYIVGKSIRMEGFIVSNHFDLLPKFTEDMGKWIGDGKMKWEETVLEGIENAPQAFLNLFSGENFGKMLVRLGPDSSL